MPSPRSPRSHCPICKANRFDLKLSLTRSGESFEIVTCSGCGFIFVADPEADTANHIDIDKIGWAFRPRHHQIRRLLLSHLAAGSRIIDIGCGRGEVGYLMRNDPVEYIGYEPARGLSDFGIRAGVPITQTTFEGNQRADALVIDNVLEHVAQPAEMLEVAAGALNPGGILIVITPNVNDIRALSRAGESVICGYRRTISISSRPQILPQCSRAPECRQGVSNLLRFHFRISSSMSARWLKRPASRYSAIMSMPSKRIEPHSSAAANRRLSQGRRRRIRCPKRASASLSRAMISSSEHRDRHQRRLSKPTASTHEVRRREERS